MPFNHSDGTKNISQDQLRQNLFNQSPIQSPNWQATAQENSSPNQNMKFLGLQPSYFVLSGSNQQVESSFASQSVYLNKGISFSLNQGAHESSDSADKESITSMSST